MHAYVCGTSLLQVAAQLAEPRNFQVKMQSLSWNARFGVFLFAPQAQANPLPEAKGLE